MSSNNSTVPSNEPSETSPSPNPPSSEPPSSSAPPPPPSSSSEPESSSPPPPPPSSTPQPSSTPVVTSTEVLSTPPPSTVLVTTPATVGPSNDPSTILVTITSVETRPPIRPTSIDPNTSAPASTTTGAPPLQNSNSNSGSDGLSPGGRTAIAVAVPVVAVALLAVAGIFLWRRRKQRKNAEEDRRKEMEEYGFNPNNDPTLPAVGGSTLAEDESGYRGWGATTTTSNRKTSTAPFSDNGSQPGEFNGTGSPHHSDGQSMDPLVEGRRQDTMDSETLAALGAVPVSGQERNGMQRGPSNASSSYSAGHNSDNSGEVNGHGFDNYTDNGYYQNGYNPDAYAVPQPIIRDVSARRNTKIESPSVVPQQGNSGIAQNF